MRVQGVSFLLTPELISTSPPSLYFAAQPYNLHHRHSYAFAVAGSLADRACIADARKGGTPSPIKLSPQDMLSCGTVKHGKICVQDAQVRVCVCVCVCVCVVAHMIPWCP